MLQRNLIKNYLAGISTGSARMLLQVAVGLLLTPFTLRYLDRQEFAIFTLTLEVLTWLTLLDIGITAGLRAQAARLNNHSEQDRINRLASTAFFAQNIIVLAVLVVGVGMAFLFPQFFPIRPDLQRAAIIVMAVSVVGVAVSIASQTFSALLVANQQMHVDNMIGVLLIAIRTVLIVVLLKLGFGVFSLAIAHVAARVTTAILAVIRVYRILPNLQIRYRLASWQEFRQIGGLGIWFSLGGLAGIAIHSLDSVVTAKVISVEAVTALVLTGRFYELSSSLVWLISETARPMLGQKFGENKMGEALKAYRSIFAVSTGLSIVVGLTVWSGNACFIQQWVGGVNYGGVFVDFALALTIISFIWVMPNRAVLSANLKVRPQVIVRLVEGGLNLCLSIYLGKTFGLIGIVCGTLIASFLTSMWLLPLLTAQMFGRRFREFVAEDGVQMVKLFVPLLPIALLARMAALQVGGYPGAIVGAMITGSVGMTLFWFIVLGPDLRGQVQSFALRLGRKGWARVTPGVAS